MLGATKAIAQTLCSIDEEHFIRVHAWTENFCSFLAPKFALSHLSGIVWTGPQSESLMTFTTGFTLVVVTSATRLREWS